MNLTDQQEKYCHEIVKGKSQFAAYQVAYPSSLKWNRSATDHKASLLSGQAKIQTRIETLRAPILRKTTYDALEAHYEAGAALLGAMEEKQFGAAVAAVQLRAKIHGLITEKREVKVTSFDHIDAAQKMMLIDQLTAIAEERKRLAAPVDVTDIEPKTDAT